MLQTRDGREHGLCLEMKEILSFLFMAYYSTLGFKKIYLLTCHIF